MNSEELKKIADVQAAIKKHGGGGMGNGERDNATKRVQQDGVYRQDRAPFPSVESEEVLIAAHREKVAEALAKYTEPDPYEPPFAPRESVLQEADRLVDSHRGPEYGPPIDDFGKVTGMALALWGRGPETEEEHALYMILVKLARLQATPGHHDSIVDIGGYIKTYAMVIDERVRRLTEKG